ncbi:hypothetical protein Q3A66_19105 [Hymenobacter sp. BT770]|nr:hypothetical protein [Hymenobacter sp. BT770]MCC3155227.1 hypothetical protein [Hymenobacter sp. BT770]MDO3417182.1 hypothetical protein [Hymenobacter sp. BT770]
MASISLTPTECAYLGQAFQQIDHIRPLIYFRLALVAGDLSGELTD